jgi:anti-sigma factor (TIGR02949 family)
VETTRTRSAHPVPDRHDPSDCGEALRQLYVFLDGELTPDRRTVIRTHLDRCACCLEAFDFEAELRVVVSTCCRGDEVPEQLRMRVVEAIRAVADVPEDS